MASSFSQIPFQTYAPSPSSSTPPNASVTAFTISPTLHHPTDIWRKPAFTSPSGEKGKEVRTFNAPIIYKRVPMGKFKRVRVSIKAEWERLYDQGGLVLVLPGVGSSSDATADVKEPELKWIKAGIEFFHNEPFVGHVACEKWADWSLTQAGIEEGKSLTIEMERDPKEGTLWVYAVTGEGNGGNAGGEQRIPIREVTWVFAHEELSGRVEGDEKERDMWVGVYAATPTVEGRNGEGDGLVVAFEGWELDVAA